MGNSCWGLMVGGAGAGALLYSLRPRDPIFEVISIELKGLKLRFCPLAVPVIDVELTISIEVTNPNVAPIQYKSTVMDIYYNDSLLGQAEVCAGSQGAGSSEILEVPATMDGLEVTHHLKDVVKDIGRREMNLMAVVTINGTACLWKWGHTFQVRVHSHIKVDPLLLDVIAQENKVHLEI